MPSIFLSYRRLDSSEFTRKLYAELSTQLSEFEVFYDAEKIDFGASISDSLLASLKDANLVFVIIGPKWLDTLLERQLSEEKDWAKEEVKLSLEGKNKTVHDLLQTSKIYIKVFNSMLFNCLIVWVGLSDLNTLLPATNISAPALKIDSAFCKPTPPSISI